MANILRKPWKEAAKRAPKSVLSLERRQQIKEAKKQMSAARNAAKQDIKQKKREYFDTLRQREEDKKEKKRKLKMLK